MRARWVVAAAAYVVFAVSTAALVLLADAGPARDRGSGGRAALPPAPAPTRVAGEPTSPPGPVSVAPREVRAIPPTAVPPTAVPTPTPAPTPVAEPTVAWLRTTRETALWSGPDDGAREFVKVPAGTTVSALDARGSRTFVYFGGDGERRRAGEAWIESADLAPTTWPRWVRGRRATTLKEGPGLDTPTVVDLPRGAYVEILGEHHGAWARAFYLGDGRTTEPIEGWVEAGPFALPATRQEQLAAQSLSHATLTETPPEVWLRVPYRSQLDGAPYSDANCGPVTVAMILDAFGEGDAVDRLRAAALELQGEPGCDTCGLFIEHLARVAEARGVPTYGLWGRNAAWRRWTIEDIRAHLRDGHVVVPQVMYRMLPGRANASFWGDHYVVVTGILGDRFIYNDPIDNDGTGFGRLISANALEAAMVGSAFPRVAFAAGR